MHPPLVPAIAAELYRYAREIYVNKCRIVGALGLSDADLLIIVPSSPHGDLNGALCFGVEVRVGNVERPCVAIR